ncbi:MAG: hypothetical protein P8Y47_08670, partial [Alphaproteobacteria bacterium]
MTGCGDAVWAEPAGGHAAAPQTELPHEMPAERAPDAPSGPSENLDLGGPPDISPEDLLTPQAKPEPQEKAQVLEAPSPSPEAKAAENAGKVEKSMSRLPSEKAE